MLFIRKYLLNYLPRNLFNLGWESALSSLSLVSVPAVNYSLSIVILFFLLHKSTVVCSSSSYGFEVGGAQSHSQLAKF
jgi:hypothetical protein